MVLSGVTQYLFSVQNFALVLCSKNVFFHYFPPIGVCLVNRRSRFVLKCVGGLTISLALRILLSGNEDLVVIKVVN